MKIEKNNLRVGMWTKTASFAVCVLIFLSAAPAFAAVCDPSSGIVCNPLDLDGSGIDTIAEAIIAVIKFLLSVMGVVSMVFIVLSGIKYVISSGNEEKIKTAKESLLSSVEGMVLALMAYGIITAVEDILQVK